MARTIQIFWQCPKCRHRVGEEESVCRRCGRPSDGREETFVLTSSLRSRRSLVEMERELREAHAEAMRPTDPAPIEVTQSDEELSFPVPKGWMGPVIAAAIIGVLAAIVVVAQILMEGGL